MSILEIFGVFFIITFAIMILIIFSMIICDLYKDMFPKPKKKDKTL